MDSPAYAATQAAATQAQNRPLTGPSGQQRESGLARNDKYLIILVRIITIEAELKTSRQLWTSASMYCKPKWTNTSLPCKLKSTNALPLRNGVWELRLSSQRAC